MNTYRESMETFRVLRHRARLRDDDAKEPVHRCYRKLIGQLQWAVLRRGLRRLPAVLEVGTALNTRQYGCQCRDQWLRSHEERRRTTCRSTDLNEATPISSPTAACCTTTRGATMSPASRGRAVAFIGSCGPLLAQRLTAVATRWTHSRLPRLSSKRSCGKILHVLPSTVSVCAAPR